MIRLPVGHMVSIRTSNVRAITAVNLCLYFINLLFLFQLIEIGLSWALFFMVRDN